ncbi:MAG: HlyD family efflux transporter periplasmic adaptor subunit [Azoarcus sp.]|jgi:HlyD family secretion protein|nr:HlyD family efflux transporter periplasmic adaptor subunit [Azoarcus sp.]
MMNFLRRFIICIPVCLLAGCHNDDAPVYQGYVEGEFIYLAAPQAGYLKTLDSPRGARVSEGQPVFAVEADPEIDALMEAEARADSARGKVENLKEPRRQTEIATLEANLRAAQANLRLAKLRLERQQSLARENFVSPAAIDEAVSNHDQALAQVEAAKQQLSAYRDTLGREPEVRSAEAELQAAQAQTAQRRWTVERKTVSAPAAGEIADTWYRPGEWVPAGSPVASLLPDDRRRLRFYVPETELARIQPGQAVEAHCDGCDAPIRAVIDFIAPQAEYTPPVIYSQGSREKLVFRVEAAPAREQAAALRPGLPLDVRLTGK